MKKENQFERARQRFPSLRNAKVQTLEMGKEIDPNSIQNVHYYDKDIYEDRLPILTSHIQRHGQTKPIVLNWDAINEVHWVLSEWEWFLQLLHTRQNMIRVVIIEVELEEEQEIFNALNLNYSDLKTEVIKGIIKNLDQNVAEIESENQADDINSTTQSETLVRATFTATLSEKRQLNVSLNEAREDQVERNIQLIIKGLELLVERRNNKNR